MITYSIVPDCWHVMQSPKNAGDHLGGIKKAQNIIELSPSHGPPVHLAPYRAEPKVFEFLTKYPSKMIKLGLVELDRTEWASLITVDLKKDGTIRLYVNYKTRQRCYIRQILFYSTNIRVDRAGWRCHDFLSIERRQWLLANRYLQAERAKSGLHHISGYFRFLYAVWIGQCIEHILVCSGCHPT